ncbi:ROK family transcriptional regulator [Streptomyces sp. HNM0575]|nr:ROK family transcriptional regulator [Streptomyces sp. HNM0575]
MSSEPAPSSTSSLDGGWGPSVPYGRNAARVLGLLRLAGPDGADRGELALRTGLTPQAVSKITARLRSHGLVTEAGRRASTGGKPSTVLRLAPGARHAVGIQLDRDQLTAVLVDLSGGVVAGRTAPLDMGGDAESLLDAVESAVHGLIRAGLPALGAGARSGAGPEGATGGELWQQASEGEVWSASHPGAGAGSAAVVEPAVQEADARRAVEEEGELWQDAGGETEPGREGEPEPEPEQEDVAAAVAGAAAAGSAAAEEPGEAAEPGEGEEPEASARWEEQPPADEAETAPDEHVPAGQAAQVAEGAGPFGAGGRWGSVVGVGVAAPGPLDHVRGVLRQVTGFPWWAGFPLRDALARRLGMPVVVDKDTNAAALGLSLRGKESLAYLHFGTGLGAGLVLDGRIHRGRRNGAGEFGHQVVQLDGPPCRCGRNGCLEALCLDAVRRGDSAEAARVLGVGAANLVRLLDVDRVLLGGRTVLADPDVYLDGVAAQLRAASAAGSGATAGSGAGAGSAAGPGARTGAGSHAGGGPGPGSGPGSWAGAPSTSAGSAAGVRVEVVPEGARTVADGAAQLVLAPLFGRTPGAPATAG